MSYDLVVEGGLVSVGPDLVPADIVVNEGRIAALTPPRANLQARERIDAAGLLVLPGLVDAHVHCRQPGLEHKEDFRSASRAAAAGGVTTIMVMPTDNPFTDTAERIGEKAAMAEAGSVVDVTLQAAVGPNAGDLTALAEAGAISFEAFLSDAPEPYLLADDNQLARVMAAVRQIGGLLGVTPGAPTITSSLEAELQAQGERAAMAFPRSRPTSAEALGVARICLLAASSGARVHVRQVSCEDSVRVLNGLKTPAITAEVTAHNLCLDESKLVEFGPFAKVVPPLRRACDVAAVGDALQAGVLDIVVTDHAPHAPGEKEAGLVDIWKAPGGFPGLQTLLAALLHWAEIRAERIERLVAKAAEAPARIFGLYPRKGSLLPGADADMILIDPELTFTVRAEDQLSKARRTPFEGLEVKGRLIRTVLRGRTVFVDGEIVVDGGGRVLRPQAK